MNGHDAHLASTLFHVALDLDLARLEPVDETGERGAMRLLIVERAVEQRVDRVIGLRAEPRDEAEARACQHAREELEGPRSRGLPDERRQEAHGIGEGLALLPREALPQREAAAARRHRQQLILAQGPGQERALQQAGQRMVILRHQGELGERHQVEDGDVLTKLQPVGAGHRHMLVPQRADHRIEEAVAALHQDQDVSRLHRAAARGEHAGADPALDLACQLLRQPAAGRARGLAVHRRHARGPALPSSSGSVEGPDLHRSFDVPPVRFVVPVTRGGAVEPAAGGRRPARRRSRRPRGSRRRSGRRR